MKELANTRVLNELKRQIVEGEWAAGGKLPSLARLAEEFQMSVSTVREALRILEHQGFIQIEHGRGMFVQSAGQWKDHSQLELAGLESGDLFSLLELRNLLEPEMAALAAERCSPGQARQIKESAERMLEDLAQGREYLTADIAFHELIAESCANGVMSTVMKSISDLLLESRRQTGRIASSPQKAAHFHMLIALAIEQRNGELAREMMKSHLHDIQLDLMTYMDGSLQQQVDNRQGVKPE